MRTIFELRPAALLEDPSIGQIVDSLTEDLKLNMQAGEQKLEEGSVFENCLKDRLGLLLSVISRAQDKLDILALAKSTIKLCISPNSHPRSALVLASVLISSDASISADNLELLLRSLDAAFDESQEEQSGAGSTQKFVDLYIELFSHFKGENQTLITADSTQQQRDIVEHGLIKFCLSKPLGRQLSRQVHRKLVSSYFTPQALVFGKEAKLAWNRLKDAVGECIAEFSQQNRVSMTAILSNQAGIYSEALEQSLGPRFLPSSESTVSSVNVLIVVLSDSRKT